MKYFLLFEGQKWDEALELGDQSFKTFYGEVGLKALYNILSSDDADKLIDDLIIKDEKSKEYTVSEFFNVLDKLMVIT